MILTEQMVKPSQKCQTLLWEALQVDLNLLQRVAMLMSLLDSMMTESGLTQESKALRSLRNVSRDKLKQWAQALMIQIEQMARPSQKCLTLIWEAHQAGHSHLQRVEMLTLPQDSMMMALDSIQESKALKSLRKENKGRLRLWVQAHMVQIEQTVKLNQKCLTLRWEALLADHSLLPNQEMSTLLQDSMMTVLDLTQE